MEKELVEFKCMLHMPKKLKKVLCKKFFLHIVHNQWLIKIKKIVLIGRELVNAKKMKTICQAIAEHPVVNNRKLLVQLTNLTLIIKLRNLLRNLLKLQL
jgi:hypothetical protein